MSATILTRPDGVIQRVSDHALFVRYAHDRDPATREALVEQFMPLAKHLARRYAGRADGDDLLQVASIGLLKAIERFDPDRGLAFSSFAVPTILGELKRYFRDSTWTVRVPRDLQELSLRLDSTSQELTGTLGRAPTAAELAEHTGTSLEQVVEALATRSAHSPDSLDRPYGDGEDEDPKDRMGGQVDPGYREVEDITTVDTLLAGLSDRDRLILELRFRGDLTQAEIGERLGLSQMHISRIIRRSIAALQGVVAP
jgi:RNA polymerase sigma-B factor